MGTINQSYSGRAAVCSGLVNVHADDGPLHELAARAFEEPE